MIYVATRGLTIAAQTFQPGEDVDSGLLEDPLAITYLSRQFLLPIGGIEALPDELRAAVLEAMG